MAHRLDQVQELDAGRLRRCRCVGIIAGAAQINNASDRFGEQLPNVAVLECHHSLLAFLLQALGNLIAKPAAFVHNQPTTFFG